MVQTQTHTHGQLISDKGSKTIQWRKDGHSKNGAGTTRYAYDRKNFYQYFTPCIKFNSEWNTDLNVKTIKLLEHW